MGCGPFSGRRPSGGQSYLADPRNPDPNKFSCGEVRRIGDWWVAKINYPNCTNFEGNKIIVTDFNPIYVGFLDPHFTETNGVLARFIPTEDGWLMALAFAQMLNIMQQPRNTNVITK